MSCKGPHDTNGALSLSPDANGADSRNGMNPGFPPSIGLMERSLRHEIGNRIHGRSAGS